MGKLCSHLLFLLVEFVVLLVQLGALLVEIVLGLFDTLLPLVELLVALVYGAVVLTFEFKETLFGLQLFLFANHLALALGGCNESLPSLADGCLGYGIADNDVGANAHRCRNYRC